MPNERGPGLLMVWADVPEDKVKLFKLAWDAVGSQFGPRQSNTKCLTPAVPTLPVAGLSPTTTRAQSQVWWITC